MRTTTTVDTESAAGELGLERLLAELDDMISVATTDEDEGNAALAIRSISW